MPTNPQAQEYADRGWQLAQQGKLTEAEAELRQAVKQAPNDATSLSRLGDVLAMQQKLEESNSYYEKALQIDPNNFAIRHNLALNQWQAGQLQEAKANLEQILKMRPGYENAVLILGMVEENLKNYQKAATLLASVPALVQRYPESMAALANSYYRTGQREKARETLEVLVTHPARPEGVFMAAQTAAAAKDYVLAEKLFTSIRASHPDAGKLGYSLALVQFLDNRVDESQRTLLDLIRTGRESSEIYHLLGRCYGAQDKVQEALAAFHKAIDLDPSKESNYLELARFYESQHHFPEALAMAKKAVEVAPKLADAYGMKGMLESQLGFYADAIQSYARAVELDPNSPAAFLGLAMAQSGGGMTKEAAATFEKGIKQFPRDSLFYQGYGLMLLTLSEQGNSAAEPRAVSFLEQALALDPSLSQAHYELGNLLLKKGRTEEAVKHLEAAAKLDPKNSKIPFALARAYRRLGRTEEASKQLEIFQNLKAEEEKAAAASPKPKT